MDIVVIIIVVVVIIIHEFHGDTSLEQNFGAAVSCSMLPVFVFPVNKDYQLSRIRLVSMLLLQVVHPRNR